MIVPSLILLGSIILGLGALFLFEIILPVVFLLNILMIYYIMHNISSRFSYIAALSIITYLVYFFISLTVINVSCNLFHLASPVCNNDIMENFARYQMILLSFPWIFFLVAFLKKRLGWFKN